MFAVRLWYDGVQRVDERRRTPVSRRHHRSLGPRVGRQRRRVAVEGRRTARHGQRGRDGRQDRVVVVVASVRPPPSPAQRPRRARAKSPSNREQRARETTHALAERRVPGPARSHSTRPSWSATVQDRDAHAGQELHQGSDERRLRDARRTRAVRGPSSTRRRRSYFAR